MSTLSPNPPLRRLWLEASGAGCSIRKIQSLEQEWTALLGAEPDVFFFSQTELILPLVTSLEVNELLAGVAARFFGNAAQTAGDRAGQKTNEFSATSVCGARKLEFNRSLSEFEPAINAKKSKAVPVKTTAGNETTREAGFLRVQPSQLRGLSKGSEGAAYVARQLAALEERYASAGESVSDLPMLNQEEMVRPLMESFGSALLAGAVARSFPSATSTERRADDIEPQSRRAGPAHSFSSRPLQVDQVTSLTHAPENSGKRFKSTGTEPQTKPASAETIAGPSLVNSIHSSPHVPENSYERLQPTWTEAQTRGAGPETIANPSVVSGSYSSPQASERTSPWDKFPLTHEYAGAHYQEEFDRLGVRSSREAIESSTEEKGGGVKSFSWPAGPAHSFSLDSLHPGKNASRVREDSGEPLKSTWAERQVKDPGGQSIGRRTAAKKDDSSPNTSDLIAKRSTPNSQGSQGARVTTGAGPKPARTSSGFFPKTDLGIAASTWIQTAAANSSDAAADVFVPPAAEPEILEPLLNRILRPAVARTLRSTQRSAAASVPPGLARVPVWQRAEVDGGDERRLVPLSGFRLLASSGVKVAYDEEAELNTDRQRSANASQSLRGHTLSGSERTGRASRGVEPADVQDSARGEEAVGSSRFRGPVRADDFGASEDAVFASKLVELLRREVLRNGIGLEDA